MNRNVKKYIEKYEKIISNKKNRNKRNLDFYVSEYQQINDISENKFYLINNAAMFGFVVGYKAAMKDKDC